MSDNTENESNAIDLQSLINLQKEYVLDLQRIPTGNQNIDNINSQVQELNAKFKNLDAAFVQSGNSVNDILLQQGDIYDILKTENYRLNKEKQDIKDAITGQKRLININTSYTARYNEYNKILFIIIFVCIFLILMHYEYNYLNIIPEFLRYTIYILVIGGAAFTILLVLVNIASRDKMNFNKIDPPPPEIDTDSETAKQLNDNINAGNLLSLLSTCKGSECCDPNTTIYDTDKGVCIPLNVDNDTEGDATTDAFTVRKHIESFNPTVILHRRCP